jgi:hypothetical protein
MPNVTGTRVVTAAELPTVARAMADGAGLGVLTVYLSSPGLLFARAALRGAPEAISEMEKA